MKMKQLPIGFPAEVRNWIKKQAEKNFLKEAALVRQLVIEAMQKDREERNEPTHIPYQENP